jgi:hypothetical protein
MPLSLTTSFDAGRGEGAEKNEVIPLTLEASARGPKGVWGRG